MKAKNKLTIKPRTRNSITEESEKLFLFNGKKMTVYIENNRDLNILSQYLDMDLQDYLSDYHGYNMIVPTVVHCNWELSLGSYMDDLIGNLQMPWSQSVRESVPLEVFLNPKEYVEYFV